MTTIEQVLMWMDLDKRCGGYAGHCLKCDEGLRRKFDTAESETRNALADILCSCTPEDFYRHQPLLWLVALLNPARYDQFVMSLAKLAPYTWESAWQIIRLSEHNKGNWCFVLEPYRKAQFKPRFHLHPTLAPLLLAATIRAGTETDDATALLDFFAPIASTHPALQQAIPHWHAAKERREEERKADWLRRQEQQRLEDEQRKAQWAAREAEFQHIEAGGPLAILRAVLDATTLSAWDCPARWAKISEKALKTLPHEMLEQVTHKIASQPPSREWTGLRRRIEHLLKSLAHSEERASCLARLEPLPLAEQLQAACDSRWSLTYFPESWAEQLIRKTSGASDVLRTRLLSKLMRLRKRSSWRTVRQLLLLRA